MKPTDESISTKTRKGHSGKRSLLEFPPKKTASAKPKGQPTSAPSMNGSAEFVAKMMKGMKTIMSDPATGSGTSPIQNSANERVSAKDMKRSALALRRLHVTQAALKAAPPITDLLRQAAGGVTQVMNAMRLSRDEPIIAAYLAKYDTIPQRDRQSLPMEAIALAAGVDANYLLTSILIALQRQAQNAVKIIAVTNHPNITQARVTYGLLPFGERDRAALDTAMGFLPQPKGPTFIGKAIFGSGRSVMDEQGVEQGGEDSSNEPDMDKIFPPANLMQEKLVSIRNSEPRLLTSETKPD